MLTFSSGIVSVLSSHTIDVYDIEHSVLHLRHVEKITILSELKLTYC